MAILLRKDFTNVDPSLNFPYPILYVDSLNENGIISEMNNLTMVHIRNNNADQDIIQYKRENYTAQSYDDIFYNKKDGFWILFDEKSKLLSLYKKETSCGYLYNKIYVTKQYELTYQKCPRLVPRVFKKTDKFKDFDTELKSRVSQYRDRVNY